MARVLLVNPNRMRPPVSPVALDHLGEHLRRTGLEVGLLDLAFEPSPREAIDAALREPWLLVAVTVRNVDDSFRASQDFCLERTRGLVRRIQAGADCPVVLGGCGFSLFPRAAMAYCGASYGVQGEGEEPLARLARCLAEGRSPEGVPGLLRRREGRIVAEGPPLRHDLARMPPWRRDVVDNPRYLAEGAQVGFETKRGCPRPCAYCADPVAKGTRVVARTPPQVADELEALLGQGVDVLHTCDAEFNVPPDHALAVCQALAARGLGERLRWYAYAVPDGFDEPLAEAMRRAGCAGIDFTADHADPAMLARLGRSHTAADLRRAAAACHRHGIPFMLDLLLGGPGETRESLRRTIDLARELRPARVGTSVGVRLYPGTPLVRGLAAAGPLAENPSVSGLADNAAMLRPVYYVEAALGEGVEDYVRSLIAGDERFLFPTGEESAENYNYNDNSVLCEAIRNGARGAYWDILRRLG
ncbi:MAG: B12-binding domain-containing radical SAM protein [Candidatus Brocadiia bacterium]